MLRPFFPFYGSKWRSAKLYGPPLHEHVIEPFAGSAGYSLYHEPGRVTLVEADPVVVSVWRYLIAAPAEEILSLPDLEIGQDIGELSLGQQVEALIGFWLNRGSAVPKRSRTVFSARTERGQLVWGQRARERIAAQVDRIRHWRIIEGDYTSASDVEATWHIDPPYVDKGRYYRCRSINYADLACWCAERRGEVMVCENTGAAWLPFERLATIKSTKGSSDEVVWRSGSAQPQQLELVL